MALTVTSSGRVTPARVDAGAARRLDDLRPTASKMSTYPRSTAYRFTSWLPNWM
jgi:hypothetical protein